MSGSYHKFNHTWNLNQREAFQLQRQLAGQVIQTPRIKIQDITTVAGIDTHYHHGNAIAAVVTLRLAGLDVVEQVTAMQPVKFPYIPGLLSFREGPAVLDAIKKLASPPDALIFDGQGIAHPRRFGLACHLGLIMDIPSIGCAKTCLSGNYKEPDSAKGSYSYLRDGKEIIGAVVRTRTEVKPLFVSVGHRINLEDCIQVVLKSCRRYRLPEPIRMAHALARGALVK